ncbi:LAQU0S04e08438g1_1 [Lachancea quebecensis]|uniref:21S rRNA pseudouridine(2819) synthase n=1 Tax=Lachancea quebecensis TaxID=1654605 RepID=A0A0P1KRL7_9SACH|nr:LAQU0S04e08438g1_1 [Lachancea quebecensis]
MSRKVPINLVYEARNYIIVNKPPGVFCQPPDRNVWHKLQYKEPPVLLDLLESQVPTYTADWRSVHRLDTNVTGGVLVAKNKNAAAMFSRYLKKGGNHGYKLTRRYVALVDGSTANLPDTGTISEHGRISKFKKAGPQVLVLQLCTGKKHQIRQQLSQCLKLPIINDLKYGGPQVAGVRHQIALHSAFIQTQVGVQQQTHLVPVVKKWRSLWSMYVDKEGHFCPQIRRVLTEDWG